MAAYSKRHYGEREWRLEPRGIVEHYTASSTAGPALNTFIQNRPDVEYHELPGVCAHYLIDTDGTILELVPTDTRCRHTVGLNHETIGIEHVGQLRRRRRRPAAGAALLARPDELAALRLRDRALERDRPQREPRLARSTRSSTRDFQGRTHGDMKPGTMKRYRKKLADC